MVFKGISRVFSTENDQQYETIGAFWSEMSEKNGIGNLRGLGYNWTDNSIEYVIGLKDGVIEGADCSVDLPDNNWVTVKGRTEKLGQIYAGIYEDGSLTYEIEMFTKDGKCEILYYRE